ncbi:putative kelch repeat protein [Monocercomonoides exilis]|uniref:putative kelch repeat protein n=1 Tax=Monocercomonoides exilis TaxID=2049356 RepID=UPI00355A2ADC|nr:putative kelch repeat protein [Monocercomonoides exilis]|eukprot:MONOS_4545.1-p1 / transcript=MONOS_4545.1 / gene=MONOS_4545 / organism=Monocercomonoides_exilis_PA203 / gene_product=kelch repeat protein / transcript_product=kelch repeat protein / location=Mono_scaffold00122:19487-23918(-) / protein_length=1372 / sequence_SO=supercontig / SO=protein_coding / is_pseudo=false
MASSPEDEIKLGWQKAGYSGITPPKRTGQSFVNAGPTVIMFGGTTPSTTYNDAWLLDMTRVTWHRIRTDGPVPMQRSGHTAVLFGADMIVFGGYNQICCMSDLHILDLEINRWIPIEVNGEVPPPRHRHAAVRFGNKMVVFGGASVGKNGGYYNDMWMFDTTTLGWTEIRPTNSVIPAPRAGHSLSVVGKKLYLFGGIGAGGYFDDLWCFNPESHEWTELCVSSFRPPARCNHSALVMNREPPKPKKKREEDLPGFGDAGIPGGLMSPSAAAAADAAYSPAQPFSPASPSQSALPSAQPTPLPPPDETEEQRKEREDRERLQKEQADVEAQKELLRKQEEEKEKKKKKAEKIPLALNKRIIIFGGHASKEKKDDMWEYDVVLDRFTKFEFPLDDIGLAQLHMGDQFMLNTFTPYPRSGHYTFVLEEGKLAMMHGETHCTRHILDDLWTCTICPPFDPERAWETDEERAQREEKESKEAALQSPTSQKTAQTFEDKEKKGEDGKEKADEEKDKGKDGEGKEQDKEKDKEKAKGAEGEAKEEETQPPEELPDSFDDSYHRRHAEEEAENSKRRQQRRMAAAQQAAALRGETYVAEEGQEGEEGKGEQKEGSGEAPTALGSEEKKKERSLEANEKGNGAMDAAWSANTAATMRVGAEGEVDVEWVKITDTIAQMSDEGKALSKQLKELHGDTRSTRIQLAETDTIVSESEQKTKEESALLLDRFRVDHEQSVERWKKQAEQEKEHRTLHGNVSRRANITGGQRETLLAGLHNEMQQWMVKNAQSSEATLREIATLYDKVRKTFQEQIEKTKAQITLLNDNVQGERQELGEMRAEAANDWENMSSEARQAIGQMTENTLQGLEEKTNEGAPWWVKEETDKLKQSTTKRGEAMEKELKQLCEEIKSMANERDRTGKSQRGMVSESVDSAAAAVGQKHAQVKEAEKAAIQQSDKLEQMEQMLNEIVQLMASAEEKLDKIDGNLKDSAAVREELTEMRELLKKEENELTGKVKKDSGRVATLVEVAEEKVNEMEEKYHKIFDQIGAELIESARRDELAMMGQISDVENWATDEFAAAERFAEKEAEEAKDRIKEAAENAQAVYEKKMAELERECKNILEQLQEEKEKEEGRLEKISQLEMTVGDVQVELEKYLSEEENRIAVIEDVEQALLACDEKVETLKDFVEKANEVRRDRVMLLLNPTLQECDERRRKIQRDAEEKCAALEKRLKAEVQQDAEEASQRTQRAIGDLTARVEALAASTAEVAASFEKEANKHRVEHKEAMDAAKERLSALTNVMEDRSSAAESVYGAVVSQEKEVVEPVIATLKEEATKLGEEIVEKVGVMIGKREPKHESGEERNDGSNSEDERNEGTDSPHMN